MQIILKIIHNIDIDNILTKIIPKIHHPDWENILKYIDITF